MQSSASSVYPSASTVKCRLSAVMCKCKSCSSASTVQSFAMQCIQVQVPSNASAVKYKCIQVQVKCSQVWVQSSANTVEFKCKCSKCKCSWVQMQSNAVKCTSIAVKRQFSTATYKCSQEQVKSYAVLCCAVLAAQVWATDWGDSSHTDWTGNCG